MPRVYRRRPGLRARVGRVRRRYQRTFGAPARALALRRPRFHTFTENFKPSGLTILPNTGYSLSFSMDQLPQLATYSNLYKMYRVNWVQFMIMPTFNSVDINQLQANNVAAPPIPWASLPRFISSVDTCGIADAPASLDLALMRNGCKIKKVTGVWKQSCKPKPVQIGDITNPAVSTYRSQPFLQFLAAPDNVPHYGVSLWIDQTQTADMRYDVFYKVNFSVRDPR